MWRGAAGSALGLARAAAGAAHHRRLHRRPVTYTLYEYQLSTTQKITETFYYGTNVTSVDWKGYYGTKK